MTRGRHDIADINRRLARRIDDLVRRFYVAAVDDGGKYWRLGSIDGEAGQSMYIWRRGPKAGEWHDAAAGTGGDPLSLVVAAMGGDFRAALDWAADWTGAQALDTETPDQRAARERRWAAEEARRARAAAEEAQAKRLAGKALWLSGQPLAGTPGAAYLAGRAIDLAALPHPVESLRYHDALRTAEGDLRPALLAAVCDAAGFLTVHRHFLHILPDGRAVKASDGRVPQPSRMTGSAKQAYGPFGGGIIPVWRGAGHKSWRSLDGADTIIATEGLEDALSWALARPDMRIGAAVALGNLGRLWLPPFVKKVLWHRHRGDGPEAVKAFERQAEALRARQIAIGELWAPDDAKDVNEWLQAKAGTR